MLALWGMRRYTLLARLRLKLTSGLTCSCFSTEIDSTPTLTEVSTSTPQLVDTFLSCKPYSYLNMFVKCMLCLLNAAFLLGGSVY